MLSQPLELEYQFEIDFGKRDQCSCQFLSDQPDQVERRSYLGIFAKILSSKRGIKLRQDEDDSISINLLWNFIL
jgi:hypothetical protein